MKNLNPKLLPIEQATFEDGPIIVYSAEQSPMWTPSKNASVELGWVGNGLTPGVHTSRHGFFSHSGKGNPSGFRWTHFMRIEPMVS